MSDPFRLDGKRALVTGANAGIGAAIAVWLAERGAHVVAHGRRSCAGTLKTIAANGGTAEEALFDLADPEAAADAFEKVPDLDILVNNAGIIRRAPSAKHSLADWDEVMDVNLKAVFLLSQRFASFAIARGTGGRIISIASLLSFQGGILVPGYTASKHGVAGLTKAFANEWAPYGITVNAVAPGYIATDNTAALRADETRSRQILERIPAGRWGDPSDIAGTVCFLASDAAAYVTGTIINVDGGWLSR